MPNYMVHAIFKMYNDTMSTEAGRKANAAENIQEQLVESMGG